MKLRVQSESSARKDVKSFFRFFLKWKSLTVILVLALLTIGGYKVAKTVLATGVYREVKFLLVENDLKDTLNNYFYVPNYIKSWFAEPDKIFIDIKHQDFQKLAAFRETALKRNQITEELKESVPAQIRRGDKVYKAELRLKGEWIDNVQGDKWSFRVEIKKGDTLFGMRRFSLQHPRVRSYLYEWLYLKALKEEGIVALRYDYLEVAINGENLGLFALEEHFDKILIENNRRREGLLLRFNADYRYQPTSIAKGMFWDKEVNVQEQQAAYIQVYGADDAREDPGLRAQFDAATGLLQSLRSKQLPTHEVFDVEKLALYFALSDLFGARQAPADWSDFRFYYNPITGLLEPVGVEGNVQRPIIAPLGSRRDLTPDGFDFHDILFSDPVFFRHYTAALERVSQADYLAQFLERNSAEIAEKANLLAREWPYRIFTDSWLRKNQKTILGFVNPASGVHAYWAGLEGNRANLDLTNIQFMPVEVEGVNLGGQKLPLTEGKIILPARGPAQAAKIRRVSVDWPTTGALSEEEIAEIDLDYRILGAQEARSQKIFPWALVADSFRPGDLLDQQDGNLSRFDFLLVDRAGRSITIPPGDWVLESELIVPKGYRFAIAPGTRISLKGEGAILSFSPLFWQGSAESPIVIEGVDDGGRGVAVFQANEPSFLSHVIFRNFANWQRSGQSVAGSVSFYESPVELDHTQFIGLKSDDALNIFRSRFTMTNVLFEKAFGDAFDADFSNGRIYRSSFVDSENDAIDISGSRVELLEVHIDGTLDKAISAGENSYIGGELVTIRNAALAITSKDLSEVRLNDTEVYDSTVGLVVFQKKPEFGTAKIVVNRFKMENVEKDYLVEKGSTLWVNLNQVSPNHDSVRSILYGVEYGKSS